MPSLLDSPLKSNVWNPVTACDVLIPHKASKSFPIFFHLGVLRRLGVDVFHPQSRLVRQRLPLQRKGLPSVYRYAELPTWGISNHSRSIELKLAS